MCITETSKNEVTFCISTWSYKHWKQLNTLRKRSSKHKKLTMKKLAVKLLKQIIINKDGSTITGPTAHTGIFDIFRENDNTKASAFFTKRLQDLMKEKHKKKKKLNTEIKKEIKD